MREKGDDFNGRRRRFRGKRGIVFEEGGGERFGGRRGKISTVPNLKGDPKYSERGPKGDLILSKKGT